MYKKNIIRFNFFISVGFGIFMGICFPLFSLLFVNFKSDFLGLMFCIGCIMAGIIVGLTAFLINQLTVVRVIKSVSKDLKDIASGEGDLTKLINFESDDDVGKLVYWFNHFVIKLEEMVGSSKKSINTAKNEFENLNQQVTDISCSLKSIVESIDKIDENKNLQNIKLDILENSLRILDDSIIIVITSVMEFFSNLDTLSNILISQSGSIDDLIKKITILSGKISGKNDITENDSLKNSGTALINSAYEKVEISRNNTLKIEDLLEKIEAMSANVNLISINASIEASHTGVYGKGFHVVSGEIRKYAELSTKYAKDIHMVLEELKKEMKSGYDLINEKNTGYNYLLKDVGINTGDLLISSGQIKSVTEEVKSNYKMIGDLLVTLKDRIERLKDNSRSSYSSLNELKDISSLITSQIESIDIETNTINENNANILKDFNRIVERFNVVEQYINRYKTKD